jgi:hypothetical protein
MPPAGPSLTFLSWTPTKKKFKPLSTKKAARESLDASNEHDKALSVSSWSGIHSDNDTEWPPLSHSSPSRTRLVTQTWPQQPSLSSSGNEDNGDHRIMHQKKSALFIQTDR